MEEVTVTTSDLHSLASSQDGNVYYTYITEDDTEVVSQAESGQQQEVLVYDEETGEYQKCVYITSDADANQGASAVVSNLSVQQSEQVASDVPVVVNAEGGISVEDLVSLTGQNVSFIQQGDNTQHQIVYQEVQGDGTSVLGFVANDENVNIDNTIVTGESSLLNHLTEPFSAEERECSICQVKLTKKDYLTHFKESHSDVRLGCPKCPQTYHSPELLNVHYRHLHLEGSSK